MSGGASERPTDPIRGGDFDGRPTRLGGAVTVTAGLVALAASGLYSWPALALAGVGVVFLVVGVVRGVDAAVTLGALGLLGGAILAGVRGASAVSVLVAVVATVVAWDVGRNAIALGGQLGRDADTARLELTHALASVGVGAASAGVGYGIFRAATGGQPVVALVFLLAAAVLLVEALGWG